MSDNVIGLVPVQNISNEEAMAQTAYDRHAELVAYIDAGFTRGEAFDLLRMSVEFCNHLILHDMVPADGA